MDLGEDGFSTGKRNSEFSGVNSDSQLGGSGSSIAGEHPSRTLFVRNINSNVEDSELQSLFEQYGDIRTLYTVCKHRGFVMVSYYDIRAAQNAMSGLQNEVLRHRKLDIHYSIPKDNPSEKDINQGSLVIFNLDSSVSHDELRQIFGVFGEIKEIRETSHRSHHKCLNRAVPGGGRRCLVPPFPPEMDHDESGPYLPESSPPNNSTSGFSGPVPQGGITSSSMENGTILGARSAIRAPVSPFLENMFNHGISSSVPNSLSSALQNFNPHSLPEHHYGLGNGASCNSPGMAANISARPLERIENRQFGRVSSNGHSVKLNEGVFGPSGNGSCPTLGHTYLWSNLHHPQPQGIIWPNSPSFVNGIWESPDASGFHPGSLGNMRISGNSPHSLEFISHNIFPHVGGSCLDIPIPSKNAVLHSLHQRCPMFPGRGQMIPMMSSFDPPNERARTRRNEGNSNQADDKKQFELDIDRIMRGEDNRTTLMIKNIPNKYTSKMLLAAIDEHHRGTYDFIYLPIDFKNKCNVGYAFINMTDPSLIITFYQAFNGKKWEKFNSEKVASLAYARIQGKAALIAHFQNSSLMNEDKRCRPILFHTDGPNAGDQVPFPMGVNVRSRPGKNRPSTSDENQENPPNLASSEEESSSADSSSGFAKASD
ncbi:hypothetical protein F0562_032290 [Nyssa sinensis]|uniref:RRM domain-containing protein n=1 Tax=Nyssa sinensis TaxID=561372 RepID=A0A5J5AS93_9ASTE|nr:hypothetical protein F0562_032290 [Nyssa sinensis]